jgi:hypothetical protein
MQTYLLVPDRPTPMVDRIEYKRWDDSTDYEHLVYRTSELFPFNDNSLPALLGLFSLELQFLSTHTLDISMDVTLFT